MSGAMATTSEGDPSVDGEPAQPVMDVATAAGVLGVPPERVLVMVEEGLLHPMDGSDHPTFDATEVRALHDLGG
jgi:hypothetical protein